MNYLKMNFSDLFSEVKRKKNKNEDEKISKEKINTIVEPCVDNYQELNKIMSYIIEKPIDRVNKIKNIIDFIKSDKEQKQKILEDINDIEIKKCYVEIDKQIQVRKRVTKIYLAISVAVILIALLTSIFFSPAIFSMVAIFLLFFMPEILLITGVISLDFIPNKNNSKDFNLILKNIGIENLTHLELDYLEKKCSQEDMEKIKKILICNELKTVSLSDLEK